jgi:hypothetical protein
MTIRAEISFSSVRVYIGDLLHLDFKRSAYSAMQAWRYAGYYALEIYCKDTAPILVEFEREETWRAVLTALEPLRLSGI